MRQSTGESLKLTIQMPSRACDFSTDGKTQNAQTWSDVHLA